MSNVFKESLEQILKEETKVNLGSVLRRRVSPKEPSSLLLLSVPPQRQGQHLGLEEEQDISRAVIAAREKPRRLFPRTQGFLRCSCKETEVVDKK